MKSKSQKYEEAINRNLPRFLDMKHRQAFYKERDKHLSTSDVVDMAKRTIGIRAADTRHDDAIRMWVLA